MAVIRSLGQGLALTRLEDKTYRLHGLNVDPEKGLEIRDMPALAYALTQAKAADDYDDQRAKFPLCRGKPEHAWVKMDWQEAYPAQAGRKCSECGICDLTW